MSSISSSELGVTGCSSLEFLSLMLEVSLNPQLQKLENFKLLHPVTPNSELLLKQFVCKCFSPFADVLPAANILNDNSACFVFIK